MTNLVDRPLTWCFQSCLRPAQAPSALQNPSKPLGAAVLSLLALGARPCCRSDLAPIASSGAISWNYPSGMGERFAVANQGDSGDDDRVENQQLWAVFSR